LQKRLNLDKSIETSLQFLYVIGLTYFIVNDFFRSPNKCEGEE